MKNFIKNIILFILPFLMGMVVLFLVPVSKNFSYHFVKGECDDKANWIYKRIFEQEKNIDIAFSGASQTSCAIIDEYIEKELINITGKTKNVANLGYCRRGRDIQYVMLKELFRHKKPSILVIEVAEDEPKKSHPVFPYLAESEDLWGSFVFFNQRYFINIWKGIVVRFEYLKFRLFQNETQNNNGQPDFGYLPSTQIASPEIIHQNEIDWQNRNSKTKPAIIRNIELNYPKHYLKKIVQLAENNNCKVLFLYLPESGSGMKIPLLNGFYSDLGKLIILPDSIISNHSYWKDATHFNDQGAMKASQFIMSELSTSN
jgi:hypothetical protein